MPPLRGGVFFWAAFPRAALCLPWAIFMLSLRDNVTALGMTGPRLGEIRRR
jgi:hypothetical protein